MKKMKKFKMALTVLVVVLGFAVISLGLPSLSKAADPSTGEVTPPEKVTIKTIQAKKPPVVYPHAQHLQNQKFKDLGCKYCHKKEEGGGEVNMTTAVEFHKKCKTCHKEEGKGPTKCTECHKP